MNASKINAFLEEVLDKTKQGLLCWEKTASEGQYVSTIGGRFSLVISTLYGKSMAQAALAIAGPTHRFHLKTLTGETVFDASVPEILVLVPGSARINVEMAKALYAVVDRKFREEEDRAIDEALEAIKKI